MRLTSRPPRLPCHCCPPLSHSCSPLSHRMSSFHRAGTPARSQRTMRANTPDPADHPGEAVASPRRCVSTGAYRSNLVSIAPRRSSSRRRRARVSASLPAASGSSPGRLPFLIVRDEEGGNRCGQEREKGDAEEDDTAPDHPAPRVVVGTTSPYPTVASVTSAHQAPTPNVGKSSSSTSVMTNPASSATASVKRTRKGKTRRVATARTTRASKRDWGDFIVLKDASGACATTTGSGQSRRHAPGAEPGPASALGAERRGFAHVPAVPNVP